MVARRARVPKRVPTIPQVAANLATLGYKHHVFLSYARPRPTERVADPPPAPALLRQARILRDALVDSLSEYLDGADVFLDADMAGGSKLEKTIETAICESACMVALCAPVYFAHDWCGREWEGGLDLSVARLGDAREYETIIPCTTKAFKDRFYPLEEFSGRDLLAEDLSNLALWFDGSTPGAAKPPVVGKVVDRILVIMETLSGRGVRCDPTTFNLPPTPDGWKKRQPPASSSFPLRAA